MWGQTSKKFLNLLELNLSYSRFSTDYSDSYVFCTNKFDANLKKFIAVAFALENFIYETCFAAIKPMHRQFEMRLGFFFS